VECGRIVRRMVVFVIATDWKLRAGVRAELRELGIEAMGMDSVDDAGKAIARNEMPGAIVLEATGELMGGAGVQDLVARVPTIVIASRTETVEIPQGAEVMYRPVSVGEIVERVRKILKM